MPIDYSKYPPNWPDIRLTVLARAGEQRDRDDNITHEAKCEFCGLENHEHGLRCKKCKVWYSADDFADGYKYIPEGCEFKEEGHSVIVLTIAHLDHDPENQGVCTHRLAALCQSCHLEYDLPMRQLQRDAKRGQDHLFPQELQLDVE